MDMNIIFTVVTRLEISRLRTEIELIDPNAFVVMHSIKDTKGGMIKKRPHKPELVITTQSPSTPGRKHGPFQVY